MMNRVIASVLLVAATTALAVKPVTVSHTSQADFASGEAENVVIWSLGEVTLGRAVKTLLGKQENVSAVISLAAGPNGVTYVGTASKGLVLTLSADGKVATLAELPSAVVTDLLVSGDTLLAATAGKDAGIYAISLKGGAVEPRLLWSDKDATAVWSIASAGETLYAATAPNGKLFAIDSAGKGEAIFTAEQKSLRSVLADKSVVFVGTGNDGLVYRIDAKTHKSRVLLDGDEGEIVALALDAGGNLYAAGTNVTSAPPPTPASGDTGKPAPSTAPREKPGDESAKPDLSTKAENGEKPEKLDEADSAEDSKKDADESEDEDEAEAESSSESPASQPDAPKPTATPRRAPAANGLPSLATMPSRRPTPSSGRPSSGRGGNSIYRIDPEGFVRIISKQAQTICDMVLSDSKLLVATGGSGLIHEISLDSGASAEIARLDPKLVSCIVLSSDGAILAGTVSPALVARVSPQPAEQGTLISKPVDAKQVARWGRTRILAELPPGASVTLATRSGNVEEPSDETWSSWSGESPADGTWQAIGSPAGRFIQYRLTFKASPAGKAGMVDRVDLSYQMGNLPPRIEGVTAVPSAQPRSQPGRPSQSGQGALRYRMIMFKAEDPNEDTLKYAIFYRRRGGKLWIRTAKDITEPGFPWDTQTVPDGEYEIKVEATDSPDNSPGTALTDSYISRPTVVDNTGPVVAELTARQDGKGVIKLTGSIRDAASRITKIEYVVDSGQEYTVMESSDGVLDSLAEKVAATIKDQDAGPHVVTVRVADELGNQTYATVEIALADD